MRVSIRFFFLKLASSNANTLERESISEYSSQVNQFNIIDNLLQLKGQTTGSNLTHKNVTPTLGRSVAISKQYGTEATLPVGGNVDLKKGEKMIRRKRK